MKATQITHLFGISGEEEFLALKTLAKEAEEANKLAEDFECFHEDEVKEMEFDEHDYLTGAAEGAGYEMDEDGI